MSKKSQAPNNKIRTKHKNRHNRFLEFETCTLFVICFLEFGTLSYDLYQHHNKLYESCLSD
ncbi:MAG: hypothetical protein LRY46_00195, partial [Candidatus Pacebacteria bacterium]|nr:hypothetical protein [Candidatus Paceibacterota bacterium]